MARRLSSAAAIAAWCYLVWIILSWTMTAEMLLVGAVLAIAFAVMLGPVVQLVGPWELLRPRVLIRVLVFGVDRRAVTGALLLT